MPAFLAMAGARSRKTCLLREKSPEPAFLTLNFFPKKPEFPLRLLRFGFD